MLDFRWARGKVTRGRVLTFNGVGKGLAGKFYAGKVNAGNHPRTVLAGKLFKTNLTCESKE